MPGRILIADDRFASRLMLAALFSGAYYDILQADRADEVVATVRAERPGAVMISDGIDDPGAAGLCEALRGSFDCGDVPRIVVTDRDDPARTAMLIRSGADDVISRSCSDAELLARVRRLLEHRARVRDLSMQGDAAPRPHGLAEGAADFVPPPRVAVISGAEAVTHWGAKLDRRAGLGRVAMHRADRALPEGMDVLVLDADALGAQLTIRLTARAARLTDAPEVLIATSTLTGDVVAQALDIGAGGVVRLPLQAEETAARITALHQRRGALLHLRARLRDGLKSAMTDPLTGLFNRRYALPRIETLVSDVRATGRPASVLMCDLDHFKWINDTFGHPAGDAVLQTVARVMRDHLGDMGFAARVGGEEFLIALPACGRLAAASFARKLQQAVGKLVTPYPAAPEGLCVTISIGVSTVEEAAALPTEASEAADHLLSRADRALYSAKAAGRDCVMQDRHLTSVRSLPARDRHDRAAVRGQMAG